MRSRKRRRAASIARRLLREYPTKCGVSKCCGTGTGAGYALASELLLNKADLSFLVTDPVGAESLRLRAFPLAREGFCRCMELSDARLLGGLIERHPLH